MRLASTGQIRFIRSLMQQRELTIEQRETAEEQLANGLAMDRASAWIERLQELPEVKPASLTAGVYETGEGVFVVKPNRAKTRMYAKRLIEIGGQRLTEAGTVVEIEFEYAPGAIYRLTEADRMPLEKAKELTIRYGRCIVCGRRLKAAQSVERGIGPVCIKSFA